GMDATGTKDVVVHNKTGFLCKNNLLDFSERTKKLIYDDKLRKRFSRNAAIESRKYSVDVCTTKLLALYGRIISYYAKQGKPDKIHVKIKNKIKSKVDDLKNIFEQIDGLVED
ncbi:MAG: hypothetical protein Q8O89_05670, partial [Nanoarchaeota archaeon]|nr:hypothetical protein [Nanoarchaeota archaeon]